MQRLHLYLKKETLAQVFSCEFCEISKNTFFYRTLPVAAFEEISGRFFEMKHVRELRVLAISFTQYSVESTQLNTEHL